MSSIGSLSENQVLDHLVQIHSKLSALETGMQGVNARLDKVNGNIRLLDDRTNKHKDELINHRQLLDKHTIDCPVKSMVNQVKADLGEHVKEVIVVAKTHQEWRTKLLFPLIRIVGTGVALLLLLHANDILSAMK